MGTFGKVAFVVTVAVVVAAVGFCLRCVPSVDRTDVVLPIGIMVPYNLAEGEVYPEYSFRFGGLHGFDPGIFQVWSGDINVPTTLSAVRGSKYDVFSIEVRVLDVQFDRIIVSISHLK